MIRSRKNVLRDIRSIESWEHLGNRAERVIVRITERKAKIYKKMREEASHYQRFKQMRLQKDEAALLNQLEHQTIREERIIRKLVESLETHYHSVIRLIRPTRFEKEYGRERFFEENALRNDLYLAVRGIYRTLIELLQTLLARLKEEQLFIERWKGRSLRRLFSRKTMILQDFNTEMEQLLELYREERISIEKAKSEIPAVKEHIDSCTRKYILYLTKLSGEAARVETKNNLRYHEQAIEAARREIYTASDDLFEDFDHVGAAIGHMVGGPVGYLAGSGMMRNLFK